MGIPKKYLTEKVIFIKKANFSEEQSVLCEGVFLTEAQATAKQLIIDLNKLNTLLPELLKHLTNSKDLEIAENLKTDCEEVLELINKAKNLKDFKNLTELLDYIRKKASSTNQDEAFSDDMIKVLQPLCYNIASDGNSVKDRLKDIHSHKGTIEAYATALITHVPSLKNNIEELYKLFERPDDTTEPEPDPGLKAGIDWTAERAKRLTTANGISTSKVLDKFYEDYYSIEYAGVKSPAKDTLGIVDKLKSLNKILIPEFNKLGYNPEVNPFAQFLKILIKLLKENKSDIFNKLTTNTYGAVHNSFIEKHITGNMLGNYDAKNILFCDDLYNYKGLDIVSYLSLQKQTLNEAERNSKYSDNPKLLVAKIFIQQKQLSDNYKENIDELLKLKEEQIVVPGAKDNAKMRSNLEISEVYHHLFKTVPKKDVTESAAKEIVTTAEDKNIMLAMTDYLLGLERLGQDQENYEKWFKDNYKNYTRNEGNIGDSKEMLSSYIITDKSISVIFKKLKARLEDIAAAKNKKAETKQ